MTARRRALLAVAVLALLWLCRLHVTLPLAGPVPVIAFAACAEVGALAVIAAGIIRSARAWSVRAP
jgi:hypothetical protein